jgi:hypothetical protein
MISSIAIAAGDQLQTAAPTAMAASIARILLHTLRNPSTSLFSSDFRNGVAFSYMRADHCHRLANDAPVFRPGRHRFPTGKRGNPYQRVAFFDMRARLDDPRDLAADSGPLDARRVLK